MLNLLGSHDMARFLTLARGDRSALRLATLFQMTYPGAPSIYYGDEIGMAGGHDPANRGAFPWDTAETWDTRPAPRLPAADRPAEGAPGPAARDRSRSCTPTDDVFAYARQLGDETVVVALNAATATAAGRPPAARRSSPTGRASKRSGRTRRPRVEAGALRGVELGPAVGPASSRRPTRDDERRRASPPPGGCPRG